MSVQISLFVKSQCKIKWYKIKWYSTTQTYADYKSDFELARCSQNALLDELWVVHSEYLGQLYCVTTRLQCIKLYISHYQQISWTHNVPPVCGETTVHTRMHCLLCQMLCPYFLYKSFPVKIFWYNWTKHKESISVLYEVNRNAWLCIPSTAKNNILNMIFLTAVFSWDGVRHTLPDGGPCIVYKCNGKSQVHMDPSVCIVQL